MGRQMLDRKRPVIATDYLSASRIVITSFLHFLSAA